ncbi:MAG TPA: phosphate ABC transporter substrate-binding protein PstS family protein [Candidatus Thermoplasmatota archaeon]|nr:phosphate ABC transporter substrate-binding protein PstS family protein [Candidatus Thermoplasmatota archaeon]
MRRNVLAILALLVAAALAGCAGSAPPPLVDTDERDPDTNPVTLKQAGSSTVEPLAAAWAEDLSAQGLQVVVAGGGSGAGASKLCAKEVDLGDLSRTMKQSEIDACRQNGVEPVAWHVAYDGLSVVVAGSNTFVDELSVEELRHIWRAEAPAQKWSDVRAGWPDRDVVLFGPDSDSGTFEYFNEVILGKTCGADGAQQCPPRSDYTYSADDNVLVEGVAGSPDALAHFGFAYFLENEARLKAVPVRPVGAAQAVTPTFESIADGTYTPLSRPLFVYTDGMPASGNAIHRYFTYVYGDGQTIVREVGYVELDAAKLAEMKGRL